MTEFTGDGLRVNPQDLSAISPKGDDDDRMFHHDGSSTISTVGGGSDSERGYYLWDTDENAWYPLFRNADKIDGKEAGDFLWRDGSLEMEGHLDAGNHGLINVGEAKGGSGGIHLNTNHVEIHSHEAGKNVRLIDSNGLLIADAIEGGDFNVPNGSLKESGNRVATRSWTNSNADVANSDYADNADQLDGYDESAFLHVSGDQMEGVLDLGTNNIEDGGDVLWDAVSSEVPQSSLGGPASSLSSFPLSNSDLANSAVTVTAGNQLTGGGEVSLGGSVTVDVDENALDADTLDGAHKSDLDSQFVDASGDTMTGAITWEPGNRPQLERDPSGNNTETNGIFEFMNVDSGSRDGWFGFYDGGGIQIVNQKDGGQIHVGSGITLSGETNSTGNLSESGNRVATRAWTDANADVPNADYADSAGDSDLLDGEHASAFADAGHLHDERYILESGDTMSGVLTLSDGSTAASRSWVTSNSTTQSWVNNNADVPNADYANSAGDASTLGGESPSDFADSNHSHGLEDISFNSIPLSISMTKYANELSNTEIYRLQLNSGESLEVSRLDLQLKGGGSLSTPSDFHVEFYDVDNSSVIATDSADGSPSTGNPIGTSESGNTVILRITNNSGSYQNASISGQLQIV